MTGAYTIYAQSIRALSPTFSRERGMAVSHERLDISEILEAISYYPQFTQMGETMSRAREREFSWRSMSLASI